MRREYAVLLVFASPLLDRFLLARHARRGWELPGGGVEPGETPIAAARREWQEETGLPLALLEPLAVHARADGSRGHLFLGASSAASGTVPPIVPTVDPAGGVVEAAWYRELAAARPLAFPDDPYARLAGLVLKRARAPGAPWRRVAGEEAAAFIARLSVHPEARAREDPAHPPTALEPS